ncbi:DUF4446 family protein [Patescibacteria group bacterium]
MDNQIIILISITTMFAASLILNIVTLQKISKINKQSKKFFSGKNGKDLEEVINKHKKHLGKIDNEIQELFEASGKIHSLAFKGVHRVGLLRFNPFKDIGGDQSFALALLNGKNSGVVISSLHTREGTRMYSKEIRNGATVKHTLTEEEEKAIQIAQTQKKID